MYPIEKYRYYTNGKKVIAASTFAGKTVRGVAICDENDIFDLEKGKQLAAARCATKIAKKRLNRARTKLDEADTACSLADDHYYKMRIYVDDAFTEFNKAQDMERELLRSLL